MKEKHVVWPALGAAIALLIRQEWERSGAWSVFLFAAGGAVIGLAVALLWRRV